MPVKPVTTVTVLPPRCAVWRMISTRPRFLFGAAGTTSRGVVSGCISGADGRSIFLRAAKGLVHVIDSPPVGMRVFFFIPSLSKWGEGVFQFYQRHMRVVLSICYPNLSLLNGAL